MSNLSMSMFATKEAFEAALAEQMAEAAGNIYKQNMPKYLTDFQQVVLQQEIRRIIAMRSE